MKKERRQKSVKKTNIISRSSNKCNPYAFDNVSHNSFKIDGLSHFGLSKTPFFNSKTIC